MLEGQAAKIHEELWNNWSMLQFALDSYSELFRERETREILDPYGGEIFALWIWPTLWNDLILRLTRLTDPAAARELSRTSASHGYWNSAVTMTNSVRTSWGLWRRRGGRLAQRETLVYCR